MKMVNNVIAPILLIAFNRPETTAIVFQKIREGRPLKLYVAVDGPREDKEFDVPLINAVKLIVEKVDWPCQVKYIFNEVNKGAELTVSSAITWVFETEESAIIIEDDIIAPISFLIFAQEMLIKYIDDDRIDMITGSNFTPISIPGNSDYFFAKYGHTGGGWATWRRAWKAFDLYISIPREHMALSFLIPKTNTLKEANYYRRDFQLMYNKGAGNSTWDNVWRYYHRVNEKLAIIPSENLTSNIGIYGLHANRRTKDHFRKYNDKFEVNKHPEEISCYKTFDQYHFKKYINIEMNLQKRFYKKIKFILKKMIQK
jgi:hypothetical protein